MTPFEQGQATGRRIVAERPLPPELRERLAVLLRPAADLHGARRLRPAVTA